MLITAALDAVVEALDAQGRVVGVTIAEALQARGPITVQNETIQDAVLLKSDGWPTYHLAHIVDDHFMEISHVLRAEEWLPSAPLHQMIYEAFGWEMPQFAHVPVILAPDGDHEQAAHLAGLAGARWAAIEHPLDAAAALDRLLETRATA